MAPWTGGTSLRPSEGRKAAHMPRSGEQGEGVHAKEWGAGRGCTCQEVGNRERVHMPRNGEQGEGAHAKK